MPLCLALCLALTAALAGTSADAAAKLAVGYRFPQGGFLGTYTVNDQPTFCIDLNGQGPSTASGYVASAETRIRRQLGWTPGHEGGDADSIRGTYLTGSELGQLAYLADRYAATTSAVTASAAEHVVRNLTVGDKAQRDRETVRWAEAVAAHPAVKGAYDAILKDVTQRAGPYRVSTTWTTQPGVTTPGVMTAQVLSAAGTPMTGVALTARYTGAITGVALRASTGSTGTATFTVPVSAVGTLGLLVTTGALPSPVPMLYTPRDYDNARSRDHAAQRTVGRASRVSVSGTAGAEIAQVVPTVTTAVVAESVPAGSALADTITVKGSVPGFTASATASLWGPFVAKPVATDCATQPAPSAQVTVEISGDGTFTTPTVTPTTPGYYTWTEELPGTPVQAAVSTPCAEPGETSLVLPPVVPVITTKAAPVTAVAGDALTDVITVTKTAPGYRGSATASLWGPFAVKPGASDCTAPATPVAQVTVPVTGNGTVTSPPVTATAPGYYTWTDTLPATPAQAAVTTPCGVAVETTLVKAAPAVTLATVGTLDPGDDVHAELTVAGMFPGYEPGATVSLFGPFTAAPTASSCTPAKRLQQGSLALAGDGVYDTDDVTVVALGHYSWTLSAPGNTTQAALARACGSAGATFVVSRNDIGALSVSATGTGGSVTPSGTVPAAKDPRLDIPSVGIAVPLVPVGLRGTDIDVPDDPSLAGQLDAGANAVDPFGTMVIAGRASDVHQAPGGLARLDAVAVGAPLTVLDVWGKTRKFTVASVQVLPRTQTLPASLFTQSTAYRLVLLSVTDPVHYGPGGSLVTHRSHVVVVANPSP